MSSKRQLIFDDVVLKALFLLEEEDEENESLINKLKEKVLYTTLLGKTLHIHFDNKIMVNIGKYDEFYNLHVISYADRVYEGEDGPVTKMSIDRIIYYLNKIMGLQ